MDSQLLMIPKSAAPDPHCSARHRYGHSDQGTRALRGLEGDQSAGGSPSGYRSAYTGPIYDGCHRSFRWLPQSLGRPGRTAAHYSAVLLVAPIGRSEALNRAAPLSSARFAPGRAGDGQSAQATAYSEILAPRRLLVILVMPVMVIQVCAVVPREAHSGAGTFWSYSPRSVVHLADAWSILNFTVGAGRRCTAARHVP